MPILPEPQTGGITRRAFLERVAATLAVGAVGGSIRGLLDADVAAAVTLGPTLPLGTPVLVMIELAGGNDILNAHIPHNVAGVTGRYLAARPSLAVRTVLTTRPYTLAPGGGSYLPGAFDLDGAYAFHGALPWLANRWWDAGDVAVVQGVGEDVAREMSHFMAMAYRWAGAFTGPNLTTGWLGRYNDLANSAQPLGAISLAGLSQALASNTTPAVSIADIATFDWTLPNVQSRDRWLADLAGLGDRSLPAGLNKVAKAGVALANANTAIGVVRGLPAPPNPGNGLHNQLAQAATLITSGIPCQTYTATLGGWDTHGAEPYGHWDLLTQLDVALAGFFATIDASARAADVFVMITSEFGRQVSQNAGMGTDHGRASSTILVGGGVRGGRYGQMPSLDPAALYYDAMVPTVDFRSVWSTVLTRLAGGNPATAESVMGRDESGALFPDLGIFTTAAAQRAAPQAVAPGSAIADDGSANAMSVASGLPAVGPPAGPANVMAPIPGMNPELLTQPIEEAVLVGTP